MLKMRNTNYTRLLLALSLIILFSSWSNATEKDTTVLIYKFNIKKEIAPPVWHSTNLAFEEAENMGADLVIIHLNTYGGMLESADSIRTRILQSDIPVYIFIDHNAASAGALISIACDSIYMVPGATIGAATVVNQQGEVVADKYQSYMRAMMRATAEATGRDPNIAQAMVDPRITIDGVIDSVSVLTFTANEAIEHGFCEGIVENIAELLEATGIIDYEMTEQELKPLDKIISLLINPMVSGLLIMLIIGGIYFELQSPGIGFPLAAAFIAAILYFAPLYLEGLADNWEIVLFVVGVILIAVEIFAIPGFGIAGISGIMMVVFGLTLSLIGNVGFDFSSVDLTSFSFSLFLVITAIFLGLVMSYLITRTMFTQNRMFGSLALETVQDAKEGYTVSYESYDEMLGKKGEAFTKLRPAGKISIEGDIYDATALTGFIDKGAQIEVVKYEASQLFVRKLG